MAKATIRNGSSGSAVKDWQKYLQSQGYDVGSSGADGIFGSKTLAATKKYQKDKGLTVDGIVGKNTWASMETGSKSSSSKSTKSTKTKTTTTPKVKGVDDSTMGTITTKYTPSEKVTSTTNTAVDYLSNTNIVDEDTKSKMNSPLSDYLSPEIAEADAWRKGQLAKIQSGKTSWSDQYSSAINDYLNREKFEYDVDNDQLFQQALASAMNSGKSAMQDTIGQASALTGGYGSTYATSAGNQAYNKFIEDAYNNLPEYYQMAMEAYQMEGQEMLNRVNILGTADDKEYGRMVDAYNVTSDYSNTLWDRGYNEWNTTTSNAINYGNFLLNENSTIGSNLTTASNLLYDREYGEYSDYVDTMTTVAGMQNSDYWNEDSSKRDWNEYTITTGDTNKDGVLSASEKAAMNTTYSYDDKGNIIKGTKDEKYDSLTNPELNAAKEVFIKAGGGEAGYNAVDTYLTNIGKNNLGADGEKALKSALGDETVPSYYQDWTISTDTYNGGFLGLPLWQGDDHNDVYTNGSTTMTFDELKEAIENSDLSDEEKKKKIDALKKQSKK